MVFRHRDQTRADQTGFAYTAIVGLARPVDGVGTAFGGTADRSSVKLKGTQWANIINAHIVGTSIIGLDQPITIKAIYNDSDSSANVTFFLDTDQNPLNSNNAMVFGTQSVGKSADPSSVTIAARASGIGVGTYYLGAKITDPDGHVRYVYETNSISVEKADFASFKNGVVSVSGTSGADSIVISVDGSGASSVTHATRNGLMQTLDTPNIAQVNVDAGDGNDTVIADTGTPAMYALGGAGDDVIKGGAGNDTLSGGSGRNKLYGGDGNDRLNGSSGHDQLFGQNGNDRLYGNAGDDLLDGGGGVDRLWGGAGNDMLIGGGGNDKLYGEEGKDTLLGGAGSDTEIGGPQNDTAQQDGTDILESIETKI